MAGPFYPRDVNGSSWSAQVVSPNDNAELPRWVRGLYVGGAGDVKVLMKEGDVVTFVGVLAGSILPIYIKKVFSNGTTATNIIGLL